MKNFSKVLALVLVVVMTMSLVTMASAAFTDAESITKTEAVDVLSAIGVINGYTDGSYKPEGTVTRAEMAKMIAVIKNEGEDVGPMYAGACTFADAASHWAAGYIAYCAQEEIISGRNASTFDPDATVTGTEAAKMVLGALGHKAAVAGLTGKSWASTTMSLAKKYNLVGADNNMTANMADALTRENAAQLLLNGLKADMVTYAGGTTFTLADGTTVVTGATMTPDGKTMGEVYFSKLKVDETATTDVFGRTVTTWTYPTASDVIGQYSVAPYLTYTGEVTMGQLYTDLGKVAGSKMSKVEYHVDGAAKADKASALTSGLVSGETDKTVGGVGVLTEVYFNEETLALNVVEINTYAGQIGTVVPAKKDANGDLVREAYVTVENIGGGTAVAGSAALLDGTTVASSVATDAFTAADAAADTIVYYTKGVDAASGKAVIVSVAAATVVTGTNKGTAMINGNVVEVTVDSTTYPINAAYALKTAGTYDAAQTVYLDANGTVIYTEAVVSNNYALVLNAGTETTFSDTVSAQMLFADGSVQIVKLAATHDKKADAVKAMSIVTYYVDANGYYTLTDVATEYEAAKVEAATPSLGTLNADANTTFVVGTVKDGVTTYTVYNGIANVPGFTANTGKILYVKSATSASAGIVFCVDAKTDAATTGKFGMLYVAGNEAIYTIGVNGATFGNANVVIDGVATTVQVEGTYLASLFAKKDTVLLFDGATIDATTGYYTSFNFVDQTDKYGRIGKLSAADFVAYNAGIVGVAKDTTVYMDADTTAYVWNLQNKALEKTTISAIAQDAMSTIDGFYTYEMNGVTRGAVNAVYAVVKY